MSVPSFRDAMTDYMKGLANMTVTENGALALATAQPANFEEKINGRVGFFFKAVRSLIKDTPQLYKYLSLANEENVRDALVSFISFISFIFILFYIITFYLLL